MGDVIIVFPDTIAYWMHFRSSWSSWMADSGQQGSTLTLVQLPGASARVKKPISDKLMADLKRLNGQANIPT